ncbi:hypothetical protein KAR91_58160 [Candidatus Pacearchaeota archaeon]|nr:hypothetical protein [Candidatus Pacearchaeota archaeon]
MKSILTKNQKKIVTKSGITEYGEKCDLVIEISYDDECNNGHNSFHITGRLYKAGKRSDGAYLAGGCIHEIIEKHAPEFKPYVKWHGTSSDGPMHYVANSMYHARTCTHEGKKPGDPVTYSERLKFKGFPMTFTQAEKGFFDFLRGCDSKFNLEIEAVEHKKEPGGYDFKPQYTFRGFVGEWHQCPFDTGAEAHEFLDCLQQNGIEFVKTPTQWAEAVEPNLEYARGSAVWPEAKLEDFTKEKLEARLPQLLKDFKKAMEELEFIF